MTALSAEELCGSHPGGGQERDARASGGRSRDDCFDLGARRRRAIALATIQRSDGAGASLRLATPAAVSPCAADCCIGPAVHSCRSSNRSLTHRTIASMSHRTPASPRLRQSCRPRGRDRLRSPSCALATAGATDRRPPARDAAVANARSGRESPTVELAVPGLPLVLKARPPGARTSRGMLGLVAYDPRLSGTSGGCRLQPLSSRRMSGVDRVRERRRAAALARHYRDLEDLSIKEIARRLGRAEATVKAYLYDPSHANKRPTYSPTR